MNYTTKRKSAIRQHVNAQHPGHSLFERLCLKRKYSQKFISDTTGLCYSTVNNVLHGRTSVTVRTAVKIEKAFNISANILLSQQREFDLEVYRWMNL